LQPVWVRPATCNVAATLNRRAANSQCTCRGCGSRDAAKQLGRPTRRRGAFARKRDLLSRYGSSQNVNRTLKSVKAATHARDRGSALEVLRAFLKLGGDLIRRPGRVGRHYRATRSLCSLKRLPRENRVDASSHDVPSEEAQLVERAHVEIMAAAPLDRLSLPCIQAIEAGIIYLTP
jgi:hypothetical protein